MNRTHISSDIMNRMRVFESTDNIPIDNNKTHIDDVQVANRVKSSTPQNGRSTIMMMSSSQPGVQTDADGLILPKKLINPCLEDADRKQLHREFKFNAKIGKNVLNQKSELQRAYDKQKEKQQHYHKLAEHSPTAGRKSKHELTCHQDPDVEKDMQYVNPEYISARAKLRHGNRSELN